MLSIMHRFRPPPPCACHRVRIPCGVEQVIQGTRKRVEQLIQGTRKLGLVSRSISSYTHKHAGKRRAAITNKISADATRMTAPPALHWARDSRAHHPRRHGPTSTFEGFFFLVEELRDGLQYIGTHFDIEHGSCPSRTVCKPVTLELLHKTGRPFPRKLLPGSGPNLDH